MRLKKRMLSLILSLCLVCGVFVPATASEVRAENAVISVTGNRNEALIYSYLTEKMGLNSAAACGILANVYRECRFNEKATAGLEKSYGICQWYGANCQRLKDYCASKGMDYTTLAAQLYFLHADLPQRFGKMYKALQGVPNTEQGAYDAAYIFCYNYERPRNYQSASESRGELSRDTFWPVFGGQRLILELDSAEHDHSFEKETVKATTESDGAIQSVCSVCGEVQSSTVISRIAKVKLSSTSYVYSGKTRKPKVTVTDGEGKKISASNYSITYSGNCKSAGIHEVVITFKGNYSGEETVKFSIVPKSTTLKSVSGKKKSLIVKWSKNTSQTTGYELQYSESSKFKDECTTTLTFKNKTTSKTLSKLAANKRYYVRIRTYKSINVDGETVKVYSSWSKVKNTKTKK